VEGTLKLIWFQPPRHEQGYLPLHHVAQSSIQPGLAHFQGGSIHSFSGQTWIVLLQSVDCLVCPDHVEGALSSLWARCPGTTPYEVAICAEAPRWVLDDPEIHPAIPEPRLVVHTSVLSTSVFSKMTLMTCLKLGQEHPSPHESSAAHPKGCLQN